MAVIGQVKIPVAKLLKEKEKYEKLLKEERLLKEKKRTKGGA
jgi:hypothetical protein